jgi:hypothetical protein
VTCNNTETLSQQPTEIPFEDRIVTLRRTDPDELFKKVA